MAEMIDNPNLIRDLVGGHQNGGPLVPAIFMDSLKELFYPTRIKAIRVADVLR